MSSQPRVKLLSNNPLLHKISENFSYKNVRSLATVLLENIHPRGGLGFIEQHSSPFGRPDWAEMAHRVLVEWCDNCKDGAYGDDLWRVLQEVLPFVAQRFKKDLVPPSKGKLTSTSEHSYGSVTTSQSSRKPPTWRGYKTVVLICIMTIVGLAMTVLHYWYAHRGSNDQLLSTVKSTPVFLTEDILKTKKSLRSAYIKNRKTIMIWRSDPLGEEAFFNLELKTKKEARAIMMNPREKTPGKLLCLFESPSKKGFQTLERIFSSDLAKHPTNVLIIGDAGTGKTFTFRQMLPYYWAKDTLYQTMFDLVFTAYLGDSVVQNAQNLQQLLFAQVDADLLENEKNATIQYIVEHPSRVLLVLDAFDEVRGNLSDFLERTLNGDGLPGLTTIITTRPCLEAEHLLRYADNVYHLLGLNDEDIPSFFAKQMSSKEKACRLISQLNTGTFGALSGLLAAPLVATMVCDIFNKSGSLPPTRTILYNDITINLIKDSKVPKHRLKSLDMSTKSLLSANSIMLLESHPVGDELLKLGNLAKRGLEKDQVIFSVSEVENCTLGIMSGILLPQIQNSDTGTKEEKYAFRHLSLQEFFCAYRVARECTPGRKNPNHFAMEDTLGGHSDMEKFIDDFTLGLLPMSCKSQMISKLYVYPATALPNTLFSWPRASLQLTTLMEALYILDTRSIARIPNEFVETGVRIHCKDFQTRRKLAEKILLHPAAKDIFIISDSSKENQFTSEIDRAVLKVIQPRSIPVWEDTQLQMHWWRTYPDTAYVHLAQMLCTSIRVNSRRHIHLCAIQFNRLPKSVVNLATPAMGVHPASNLDEYCDRHPNCLFLKGIQSSRSVSTGPSDQSVYIGYEEVESDEQIYLLTQRVYWLLERRAGVVVITIVTESEKSPEVQASCSSLITLLQYMFIRPLNLNRYNAPTWSYYLTGYDIPKISFYYQRAWLNRKCKKLARLLVRLTEQKERFCPKVNEFSRQ